MQGSSGRNGNFSIDTVVVGGGLAGLTAGASIARQGKSVIVLEKSTRLGGRAATNESDGVYFNLGPHALYLDGPAYNRLRDLGVSFSGSSPRAPQVRLFDNGRLIVLPLTPWQLMTSTEFSPLDKWRLARFLSMLRRQNTRELDRMSLEQWIEQNVGGRARRIVRYLFRLSTYSTDFHLLSAGAAIDQVVFSLRKGVWYLDYGWQTLVDGVRDALLRSGGQVLANSRAVSVEQVASGVRTRLADGTELTSNSVILAVEPLAAKELLHLPDDEPLVEWHANHRPVRAACLDVALSRLPRPENRLVLGTDQPLYYSLHSAAAKLAPTGVSVVHVAKYLSATDVTSAEANRAQLEDYLDRIQPGWREFVVARRFLPSMVVAQSMPEAKSGGTAGRPGVEIAGQSRVFLAGDWVGPRHMLLDAAIASAEQAAQRAIDLAKSTPSADRSEVYVHG